MTSCLLVIGLLAAPPPDGETPTKKPKPPEQATFGGGCFWSMEAIFERIPGVISVTPGYAGGFVPNPTYEMVRTGRTGHAEVIHIEFDPNQVTYDQLLKVFWAAHDPTTPNRQGPDIGPNYRSLILYHDESQREAARESYRALTAAKKYRRPIVTQLFPLEAFYPAEPYHQDYYAHHRNNSYSHVYIIPKLRKLGLKP
jgi:peptide-methionine (S)-S-oxide reductase